MAYDKTGHTRYPGQRLKDVIGPHVAVLSGVAFDPELNFTAAGVQHYVTKSQTGNIQFTKADVNGVEEAGNVIGAKVLASGLHTLTFSSDFVEARNDFTGSDGTYYIWFTYMADGKILYSVIDGDA